MHNPFRRYPVSGKWRAGHQAVDYAVREGTAFGSPAAGVYRHDGWFDDAGIRGTLHLADGRRILFCHLLEHVAADGARVTEGQTLALTGNTGVSTGPHMHTYGLTARGARWDWTRDAAASVAAAAVAGLLTPKEDTDMHVIRLAGRHIFVLGREYLAHMTTSQQADIARKIGSTADELHEVGAADFRRLLDAYGIPRDAVDENTGAVTDALTGKRQGGGVWSRQRAIERLLRAK